jgi:hypothetical protein
MTDDEIKAEIQRQRQQVANAAKEAREESKLPRWCLAAIAARAYEDGHANGQQEVDNLEIGLIDDFEAAMEKEQKSS